MTEQRIEREYKITNIRRGKGPRSHLIYAQLMLGDELVISALLEYIVEALPGLVQKRLEKKFASQDEVV